MTKIKKFLLSLLLILTATSSLAGQVSPIPSDSSYDFSQAAPDGNVAVYFACQTDGDLQWMLDNFDERIAVFNTTGNRVHKSCFISYPSVFSFAVEEMNPEYLYTDDEGDTGVVMSVTNGRGETSWIAMTNRFLVKDRI